MTPFTNQQVVVLLILMVFAAGVGAFSTWSFLRTRKPVDEPKPEEKPKKSVQRVPAIEVSPNLTTGKVTVVLRVTGDDGMADPNAWSLTGLWGPAHARDIASLLTKASDIVDPPKPVEPVPAPTSVLPC